MINGLDDYENYKILRPLYSNHDYDNNGFPIIKKDNFDYSE